MKTTVITGSFSADHQKPYGKERHGHDWHVRARVPVQGDKDGPSVRLDAILGELDHRFLDVILRDPSNEGVAEWIGEKLGAVEVYVWRFDRGREFGGSWCP